ncbi:MAG: SDR family oxidoreductase [bacterium]|nr:SDR family oxidoreductase [bacterium]
MEKNVLVVIGVGGMGLAIARRCGSGKKVILADFNEQTLAAAAEQLRIEGHDVTEHRVDVSDLDSVTKLAQDAAAEGPVLQVAHTAGLSPVQAPTDAIIKVDLLGVAYVLDAFAEVIASGGAGVVIASMAGHFAADSVPLEMAKALSLTPTDQLSELPFLGEGALPNPGAAYSIAKRANALRVQAAAGVWGQRGARINSISPGIISTPMGNAELDGESGQQMRGMIAASATGRTGTPDDIAAATAFLLDAQQSSFITGTDLLVDGGAVAGVRWHMNAG